MKRNTKYVGLDVHQATTVASVRETGGRVIARSIIPTEAAAILEFFAGMRGAIHVAFEEGTQARWFHELVSPVVDRVVVCDRRGEPKGNKGDQVDADRLSHGLLTGGLRAVYHGSGERVTLQELARAYRNVVSDSTRVKLRLKAIFRARAIRTRGKRVYGTRDRAMWLAQLSNPGARMQAELLYDQLDGLNALRERAKAAMVAEARRDRAWASLKSIPYMGPVRIALILAIMKTPLRFRSKRHLWGYAGFAVVTHSSGEHDIVDGRVVRRRRKPLTRGLNRNHNPVMKAVFKGAANSATARPGPLQDFYRAMLARGMRPEMARVTLARKLAAVTLHVWKTGEAFDPTKLTGQAK